MPATTTDQRMRRLLTAASITLQALACAALLTSAVPVPADAQPVIRQTATGTATGATFTATLPTLPQAGNSIVVVVGLDAATQVGTLEADDVTGLTHVAETAPAFQQPGVPYGIVFAVQADPVVRTWGFHGLSQSYTWLVAEISGLRTFESGVPIWDGPAWHSTFGYNTPSLSTGTGSTTTPPRELMLAVFVARPAPLPPTTFDNGFPQVGQWDRLGTSVANGHRLDVAYKSVKTGLYGCTGTWSQVVSGAASMVLGFYAN